MTDPINTWLRPLDDGDPGIDLRERASRGPSPAYGWIDTSSHPRSRLGAAIVAIVVFGAAVAFAWNAFSPSDGTAPAAGPDVFMAVDPTTPNAVMAALMEAPVVVRNGCVLVGSGSDLALPIWPKGYTADRGADGRLVIKDADGSVVGIEGTEIRMGGGYVAEFQPADKVEPKATQVARVESSLGYPIPDSCFAGIYGIWLVGEVSPSWRSGA
jgi:hypothetical protein